MVFELIVTGLLAYGVASTSVNASNGYRSVVNSQNNENIVEVTQPNYANTFTNRVTGVYNFRDEINFYDWFGAHENGVYSYTVTFDEDELGQCPISFGSQKFEFLISLYVEITNDAVDSIYLDFYTYDDSNNHNSHEMYFNEIITVDELDYPYLFFNYSNSLVLSAFDYETFDLMFTHDDNQFIVSYTEYYNFLTNSSLRDGDKFSILGSIVYNNIICNALYFQRSGIFANVYYVNYDVASAKNIVSVVSFETFRGKPNVLLNGVKMQVDTYNELSTIGVFSYVRDTQYDDTDFHDLLFTIMDTPIYFFSRLFDFQFFGVNLYIALSGLITLAIVVIVIRKIW